MPDATYTVYTADQDCVHAGTALACVIALMETLDAVELAELEKYHLPRVTMQNRDGVKVVKFG